MLIAVLLCAGGLSGYSNAQGFSNGFESPITLNVATFNILQAFRGTIVDNQFLANPQNVNTTIDKFNELSLDFAGLQEAHDFAALQTLAAGTNMELESALSHGFWIYPTAVLSAHPIVSRANYNTDGVTRLMTEIGVRLPDGTLIYVFSIHLSWEGWKRIHTYVTNEIILRRAGSHPVIVTGDMNGSSEALLSDSRGTLRRLYSFGIDAILGTPHFVHDDNRVNHGNLGFSDHPLVTTGLVYTPGTAAQAVVPSLYHDMAPSSVWNVGDAILPNPSVVSGIRITSLPELGLLKMGLTPVEVDTTIPAGEVTNLVYETGANEIGKVYFSFELVEHSTPTVQVPRFVDIFIESFISNIQFAPESHTDPPTTSGHGYADLAHANVGDLIYTQFTDDFFNEDLPESLRGLTFIRNGGRNENTWPGHGDGPYMNFDLALPAQLYIALGHRFNGTPRTMDGWTLQWADVHLNSSSNLGYDIFTRHFDPGTVFIEGNQTPYPDRNREENLIIFADPD